MLTTACRQDDGQRHLEWDGGAGQEGGDGRGALLLHCHAGKALF